MANLAFAPALQAAHVEQTTRAQAITCTEPITVGVVLDLTGPLALYGAQIERSFPLGMEYIAGPPVVDDVYMLDGCEIRLLWGDDQSSLATGDAVARHLVEDGGAQILVGTVSSGVTARLQEIAEEYNIIHIAAPAASNDITGINFVPNSFRTSRNNYQDVASLCQYLASQPGALVQIAPDTSFGRTTSAFYRDACQYYGAEFAAGDIFAADGMNAALMIAQAITASGGDASADALIAALEGMAFAGPKGTVSIRPEDHVAVQDMYIVRLSNVDDPASDFFETVATNRPEPPCLLPAELEHRCGALPIGALMRPVYLPLVSRQ